MVNAANTTPIVVLLILGTLLIISACTMIPVQKRNHLPKSLPDQYAGIEEESTPDCLSWEDSFASEYLKVDVQTLIQENFELKAARARVAQAAAAFGIAQSGLYPAVDAIVDFDRSRIEEDKVDGSTTTRNTIAFGAALNWELDIWGRLRSRREAAALSLEEKQALVDRTALDLQTLLVESWVTHYAARKLEKVLLDQRNTNAQFLNLTELRLAYGQGNALDVLQQRGRLVTAERARPAVTSRKVRAANAYAVLLGRIPTDHNLTEDKWPVIDRLRSLPSPRQLLVDRPDVRAAFLALQAADYEVAAAVADRLPRLSLEILVIESGDTLSNIGNGSIRRFASGLLAPVFDAGRLKAKVSQRYAEAREVLAALEQALRTAVREVEDAVIQEQALLDEQALLQNEIAIADETVDKATMRYVNGQESFLSVLVALTKLQTLQQNEISLQKDLLINRSRLLKALVVQWSHHCETP